MLEAVPHIVLHIFMEILTSIYFVISECLKKMKSTFRLYREQAERRKTISETRYSLKTQLTTAVTEFTENQSEVKTS